MTLGMNGRSTTLYRVVFGQARDGVSACAIAEKNTAKKPANAITGTNVAVRMINVIECWPVRSGNPGPFTSFVAFPGRRDLVTSPRGDHKAVLVLAVS